MEHIRVHILSVYIESVRQVIISHIQLSKWWF